MTRSAACAETCGAALLILSGLFACDSQSAERSEARELLAKLNTVADERSFSERHAALEVLAKLRLDTPQHVAMRDACLHAHRGLLDAETSQASARQALARVSSAQPGGAQLSQSEAARIQADIDRSNQALAEAKNRFPTCERAIADLTTKAH